MVITFFSAEKMSQNYISYPTYANNCCFFCLNAIFFAHNVYYLQCCNVKIGAKV